MILYILPFLGGRIRYYDEFIKKLYHFTVIPLEFKKGGSGFEECLEDFKKKIEDTRKGRKFSLWGHSVGALYAYELACAWEENQDINTIFLSGRTSLNYDCTPPEHIMGNQQKFKRYIGNRYGYTDTVLDSRIGTILVHEIWQGLKIHRPKNFGIRSVNKKIIVFYGTEDELCRNITSWDLYSDQEVSYFEFQGGHFFLTEHVDRICQIIEENI